MPGLLSNPSEQKSKWMSSSVVKRCWVKSQSEGFYGSFLRRLSGFFTIDVQVTTLQGSKCIFRHSFRFAVWVHTKPHFYQGTMTSGRWSSTEFVARLSDRKARTVAPSGHFHVISFLTLHTLVTRSLGVRSPRRLCRSTNAHQSSALRKVNVLGWQAPFCSRLTQWPPLTCPGVTHPGPPSWALTWRGLNQTTSLCHTHTHTHTCHMLVRLLLGLL